MVNNFFFDQEKSLQKKLLRDGYIIFNIKDKKRLNKIKQETIKFVSKWIKQNINIKKKIKNVPSFNLNFILLLALHS